jgi:hypothetical protein
MCSSKCLLALTCVHDHHQHRGFPLANFVCAKLCPQCISFVSHDIELDSAVVVLGLDILEDVKVGIMLVHSIVMHLQICEALPGVRHPANLTPGMLI